MTQPLAEVLDRAGEDLAVRHIEVPDGIDECSALDRQRQVHVWAAQHHLLLVRQELDGLLLLGAAVLPVGDGVVRLRVHRSENEILVFLKAHARVLRIGIRGVQRRDPLELAFRATPHLCFGDRAQRLVPALHLGWIDVGAAARVGRGVHADSSFELIVRQLQERRGEVELRVICVLQVQVVLAERHHSGQVHHRMRDAAALQYLPEEFSQKGFGRGGALDQDAVARQPPARNARPGSWHTSERADRTQCLQRMFSFCGLRVKRGGL